MNLTEKTQTYWAKLWDLCQEIGLPIWVEHGAALCLYRDNCLHMNTNDMDIGYPLELQHLIDDNREKFNDILDHMFNSQTFIGVYQFYGGQLSGTVTLESGWKTCPSIRLQFNYPPEYFNNFVILKRGGMLLPFPSPIEEYLEWQYGKGWRYPLVGGAMYPSQANQMTGGTSYYLWQVRVLEGRAEQDEIPEANKFREECYEWRKNVMIANPDDVEVRDLHQ